MTLSPRLRKLVLTLHVSSSVGWLGAAVAYLAVAVAALTRADPVFARGAYPALELIGWFVIVPLCVGASLSGVLQALGTPWGLFRHYWIVAKVALTAVGTIILLAHMPGVSALSSRVTAAPAIGDLGIYPMQLVIHAALGSLLLVAITLISVFKPWGKTPLARRG